MRHIVGQKSWNTRNKLCYRRATQSLPRKIVSFEGPFQIAKARATDSTLHEGERVYIHFTATAIRHVLKLYECSMDFWQTFCSSSDLGAGS